MWPWELLLHSTVASCWGLWPARGGCCSASHGTGMLHVQLWIQHFPPQSCSRAQSELPGGCAWVRRHRGAGRVCGSSSEPWPHCTAQDSFPSPVWGASAPRAQQTPLQDTNFATSARWLWMPLGIPVLQCPLAGLWPSLLVPPALPAVVIPCVPEGIRCAEQDERFWLARAVAM